MSGYITMLVVKGGETFDMSQLVDTITWSGRRGTPARKLDVTFLDNEGHGHSRSGIDVDEGHQCVFFWKGQELFRGMFVRQGQSRRRTLVAKAYDNGFRLLRNKDTFNYSDIRATDVFNDVCRRFGIPFGSVADTRYRIPELPKPKTTAWDAIADALGLTFKATGVRYFVMCSGARLSLIERRMNILQWVIESGVNLGDYSFSKNIENIKTRVRILSSEDEVVASATNAALERRVGIFQSIETADDEMNVGQLNELVESMINEHGTSEKDLILSNILGIPEVIAGIGVFIIVRPLGISRTYYVEQDTHTFSGTTHMMSIKLDEAMDVMRSPRT